MGTMNGNGALLATKPPPYRDLSEQQAQDLHAELQALPFVGEQYRKVWDELGFSAASMADRCLLQMEAPDWRAFSELMHRCGGKPQGIEWIDTGRSETDVRGTDVRWKMLTQGRPLFCTSATCATNEVEGRTWTVTTFDRRGPWVTEGYDSLELAALSLARSGFKVAQPGVLNVLRQTPAWAHHYRRVNEVLPKAGADALQAERALGVAPAPISVQALTQALRPMKFHDFHDCDDGWVYDETQTNDDIKTGDILKLSDERYGVMYRAWPMIIVGESDVLHRLELGEFLADETIEQGDRSRIKAAVDAIERITKEGVEPKDIAGLEVVASDQPTPDEDMDSRAQTMRA